MKAKRGRRRYILFNVSPGVTRESLIRDLRVHCVTDPPYVVQCIPGKAILRCSPAEADRTIEAMDRIDPASSSVTTSGTLRKIRAGNPDLKASAKKRT